MKFYIQTFGCQMNEYDSLRLEELLISQGHIKSDTYIDADLVILNTCSIREKATHKVYSMLGKINLEKQKMKKSEKYMVIAVMGCVVEVEGADKMFIKAPYIDIVLGPQSHKFLMPYVKSVLSSVEKIKNNIVATKTHFFHLDLDANNKFEFLAEERQEFNGVSAYITIQEGCNKFCTYCVVPNTRGRELARKPDDILNEAKSLVKMGVREIVLLGQNVSSYKYVSKGNGNEITWRLVDLIKEIAKIPEIVRIRYITSHPIDITDELIELHKNEKKLMPYLHLPVQSGSNVVLKKMNRKYTAEFYLDIIDKYRQAVPDIVFSSDFIVGFPSESDDDFNDTLKLVEKVNYKAQCFSFKYSPRPNTVASLSKEQIPDDIASKRLDVLQDLLEKQRMNFAKEMLNKIVNVLFDNMNMEEPLQICGRDEYMHLVIVNCHNNDEKKHLFKQLLPVKIIKIEANVLIGELV
ncbi:MAG: tRNA (N6-isopentenyl adenosine(37)-C2)-methylthiotransferase MiaB [Rickettsiales bacterium]|nr:tRNA (N6-isopentenyl adenosine(37)-C2)-methylthiotransferase MiaB [Rickettsiales bacterium]